MLSTVFVGVSDTPNAGIAETPAMASAPSLGAVLKSLREERELTQVDVAVAVGIARTTLASIEAGHDLPGRETLAALARFYGVKVDLFYGASQPAGGPQRGYFVDDPDKLALLGLWDDLNDDERGAMLRMLRAARLPAGKTA